MYIFATIAWVIVLATALPGTTYLWQNKMYCTKPQTVISMGVWQEIKKVAAMFF
ncbi:MAG: hypothetical protein JNK61_10130 [Bacteroidia bacterium]|nr:hypothetical protein [Bacteroidia bacterium]